MSTHLRKLAIAVLLGTMALLLIAAKEPHAGPAMNYHPIDDSLATGGHFVDDGLEMLASDGLEVVIDLRPEDAAQHRERVTGHKIEYVHVPVSWENPQPEDFNRFVDAMNKHRDKKVLVQCAANYRASAMTYLYRALAEGVPDEQARTDMLEVWKPNGNWRKYIAVVAATYVRP